MFEWVLIVLSLFFQPQVRTCTSTIFGQPGDKHAGGEAVCLGRKIGPHDIGVAHRTLPCGSRVVLVNPRNGRTVIARTVDRGPYGGLTEDGTWFVRKRSDEPGKWRGCLDITYAAARKLRHNGFQKIKYYALPAPMQHRRWPMRLARRRR